MERNNRLKFWIKINIGDLYFVIGVFNSIIYICTRLNDMVDVAQLVRAPDCGSGGRGFKSHLPPNIKKLHFREAFLILRFPLKRIDEVNPIFHPLI